ncbi:MAG: response regulator [Acidobacteria bacterium]|nr:response regulator [Acidobacteriota bacterium]MBV8892045.1 response regulator [Acidobacteriota bacterium]MBV9483034.1 response regulator [Acidobacteriota bacterium]
MARESPTILCIDDEQNALKIRKMLLERSGYRVLTTADAATAIEMVQTHPVDLVISDHLLVGGTGTELAKEIKELRPGLPVILLSGVNDIPADADNADQFVSKMVGPDALLAKIAAILKAKKADD